MATQKRRAAAVARTGTASTSSSRRRCDRQDFDYLRVVDHEGIVRGSNVAARGREEVRAAAGEAAVVAATPASRCRATGSPTDATVLDFGAPVLFQGKEIGQVHLGIYEAPLAAVARLMLVLLGDPDGRDQRGRGAAAPTCWRERLMGPIRVLRNSLAELGARPLRLPDRRSAQRRIGRAVRGLRSRPPPRCRRATSGRRRTRRAPPTPGAAPFDGDATRQV